MATVYLFGDEAGNFDFSDGSGASRYFVLATVTMHDWQAGDRLQALRRRLAWRGGAPWRRAARQRGSPGGQGRGVRRARPLRVADRCDDHRQARGAGHTARRARALPLRLARASQHGSPARSLAQATAYSPSPPISAPASAGARSTSRSTMPRAARHAVHTAWRSGPT
jgi:hypothetical protein